MGICTNLGLPRRDLEVIKVPRAGMISVVFFKYLAREIDFTEFKERVKAFNLVGDWVEDFMVSKASYHRVTLYVQDDNAWAWAIYLDHLRNGHFKTEFIRDCDESVFKQDRILRLVAPESLGDFLKSKTGYKKSLI